MSEKVNYLKIFIFIGNNCASVIEYRLNSILINRYNFMIIVFEGLDGSGKGTQSQILSAKMSAKGMNNALYSFPNYKGTNFGLEVGKYLNGQFGALDEIPPQFPVMLYAMDRFEMKKHILKDIYSGANIIFDRYVPSNIAHQAIKFPENMRKSFIDWVKRLEYNILEMPYPDIVIFLDVNPTIASKMVSLKGKRVYTDSQKDIHEANNEYMQKVYDMYKMLALEENWIIIESTDGQNMLSQEEITNKILEELHLKSVF